MNTNSNVISNTIKIISEKSKRLSNFQRISYNNNEINKLNSQLNQSTTNIKEMAIQIMTIPSDKLIELLNKYDKLRTDFFKFELYKEFLTEKQTILIDVLLNVSSNTTEFCFFIDYLFTSQRLDLLHCVIENCQSLYENQVVYILKNMFSIDREFKEMYFRKNDKMNSSQLVYKGYNDYITSIEFDLEANRNNKEMMYKVYMSYVLYKLLTSSNIISDELFMKTIINEITIESDKPDQTNEIAIKNEYDIKFLTEIYLLLIFLMNSTSDTRLINHMNTILNCFLYLHHIKYIDDSFISHIIDTFNERLFFEESLIFNEVENREKVINTVSSFLNSAVSVKFALGLKGNLNFNVKNSGCYVLSDRISIK